MPGLPLQSPNDDLAGDVQRFRANMVGTVVSIVLIIIEFLHALHLEVPLIWQSKWSLVKALYIANRALPFVVLPFPLILFTFPNPAPLPCKALFAICVFGISSCILLAEALLYVRLYALSGRAKAMRIFLISNAIIVFSACFIVLALFIYTGSWGESRRSASPFGCTIMSINSNYIVVAYLLFLYSGMVTLVLSMALGWINYRSVRDYPLIQVFYRDGIIYFVVLAAMAILNAITAVRLPIGYQFLLGPFQAAVHSILVTRMVLHLKQQALSGAGLTNEYRGSVQIELTTLSTTL